MRETSLLAIVARAAERLIAGGIVYAVDIRIDDGPGGRRDLDIVPDIIGMAFIVWGLATLRRRSLTPAYDRLVRQCYLIACVGLAATVVEELSRQEPMPRAVGALLDGLAILGLYLFVLAMIELVRAVGLGAGDDLLGHWQLSRRLVVGIYVPGFAVGVLLEAIGSDIHIESLVATVVAVVLAMAPIVWVLVSLVRTRRAAWEQLPWS